MADGVQSTNGLRVVSADGGQHTLRVLVPGTIGAPTTAGPVTLLGRTAVDPSVRVQLGTPGAVRIDGPADLTGTVAAGKVVTTGTVTLRTPAGPVAP